jgi:hypothetical protein
MDSSLKKKLRALSLALRHTLEGTAGQAGDLESRLNQMGVWRDRPPKPAEVLGLSDPDHAARRIVDAFLTYREEAGVSQREAFAEFVRESAYSWANRLFMLRCLESRELIDEVILQKQVYGGRSLVHHRFAQQNPSACAGEDDGLFSVLEDEFRRHAEELPTVFNPRASAIALRPSISALKRCIGLLSGSVLLNGQGEATEELFDAGDAPGWAYQFWNAEEKDHVFERVRTQKDAKIEGADLIPATQLYTEPYMVKFLVQHSMGAFWAGMYPETKLTDGWEYYVRDADRTPPVQPDPPPFDLVKPPPPSADPWVRPSQKLYTESGVVAYGRTLTAKVHGAEADGFVDLRNQLLEAVAKPVLEKLISLNHEICEAWDRDWPSRRPKLKKRAAELTFLDPACGSGHFLLEAFDLLNAMYEEEGILQTPEDRCASILNNNLFGIDIDERAIQISVAALWMHALSIAPHLRPEALTGLADHIVAANLSLPRGRAHLEEFLAKHPDDADLRPALEAVFRGLADANQLGTLLRIEEPVEQELRRRKEEEDRRSETSIRRSQRKLDFMTEQEVLTVSETRNYGDWKHDILDRLKGHFRQEAAVADPIQAYFGVDAEQGLALFELLSRRYDVVAANPPYLGHGKAGRIIAQCLSGYAGGTDLYGAFIQRVLELTSDSGLAGILSLANYLHSDDFLDLRKLLLSTCQIQSIVNLGNKVFEDLSNPNATYFCMAVFSKLAASAKLIRTFDLDGLEYSEKGEVLLDCLRSDEHPERSFSPAQTSFTLLPGLPFAFRLPTWARVAYHDRRLVKDVADCRQGLITGDTDRFLRYRWETSLNERWIRYAKGGPYRRWLGNDEWAVDWQSSGARIRHFRDDDGALRSRPQNLQYFGRHGCSWSSQTISAFAVRRLEVGSAFDTTGSSAFPNDGFIEVELLMAVFNTPAFGEIFSAIQPGVHFGEGYLETLPFPRILSGVDVLQHVESCVSLQKELQAFDLTSEQFAKLPSRYGSFQEMCAGDVAAQFRIQLQLHELECQIWDRVEAALGVPGPQRTTAKRYGPPEVVQHRDHLIDVWLSEINAARPHPVAAPWRATQNKVEEVLARIRCRPSELLELIQTPEGPFVTLVLNANLTETANAAMNLVTASVLRLLGHYRPSPDEDDALPRYSDHFSNGIIAINGTATQFPLMRLVVDSFGEKIGHSLLSGFERSTGAQLARWLERQFYSRHTTQFLGRPIAWQIQTQACVKGALPILSCLVYYRRIVGALPNLRTQYAGALRASFESEQRTLQGLTQVTPDQTIRKENLGSWIDEIKLFKRKMKEVEAPSVAWASGGAVEKWSTAGLARKSRKGEPSPRFPLLACRSRCTCGPAVCNFSPRATGTGHPRRGAHTRRPR